MSQSPKIIAYRNSREEWDDSILGWFCDLTIPPAFRALKWFLIISSPVFLLGAAVAPQGVGRIDHGIEQVGKQHSFMWYYATAAVYSVVFFTVKGIEVFNENGQDQTESVK